MNKLYETIDELCKERKITITEMCRGAQISRGNLSDLKMGRQSGLSATNVNKLANYFSVSVDFLLGGNKKSASDNTDGTGAFTIENDRLVRFPIIGSISAGYDGLAEEEYTGEYTLIPYSSLRGAADDYFILRVSGNSMYPRLLDGDKVLVHRTTIVDNGKVAVVLYNGDAATVKKVEYELGKSLDLIPYNPEFQVKTISGVDLEQCRILGEVVQLIRDM
ncbi:MAG: S24 family peptidase [Oscillospiraceae bacterium]